MLTYDLKSLRHELRQQATDDESRAFSKRFAVFEEFNQIPISLTDSKIQMAIVGLCVDGEGDVVVDTHTYHFEKNSYIVLLPNQVVRLPQTEQHLHGIFICISEDMYTEVCQGMHDMLPLFFYVREHPCSVLDEENAKWILRYHKQILKELKADNIFRRQTSKALMVALMYKVFNLYSKEIMSAQLNKQNRQEEIFTQFLLTVEKNYREHREVSWYADQLFISPKYLSTTVKKVSGKSANTWIESAVINEAKVLLKTTHYNIQQIADMLNFPSQSFFGKYFKQYTGYSPREWRQQMF